MIKSAFIYFVNLSFVSHLVRRITLRLNKIAETIIGKLWNLNQQAFSPEFLLDSFEKSFILVRHGDLLEPKPIGILS